MSMDIEANTASDEIAMRQLGVGPSGSKRSNTSRAVIIGLVITVVLVGVIVGILFGAKVIGSSSSSDTHEDAALSQGASSSSSSSGGADEITQTGASSSSSGTNGNVASSSTQTAASSSSGTSGNTALSSTQTVVSSSTIVSSSGTKGTASSSTQTAASSSGTSGNTALSSTQTVPASSSSSSSSGSSSSSSSAPPVTTPKIAFGTFKNPFAATSLWNARPIAPVFDIAIIPPEVYYPSVSGGDFSTQVFHAQASDPPLRVYGSGGAARPGDPDNGGVNSPLIIPHWPSGVIGAVGGDGHADIFDETTGIIHSFWQLRNTSATYYYATLYSWMAANGTGWPDPAHYYQGARAVGIGSGAGTIRNHEQNDTTAAWFPHALAMSLTFSGLGREYNYVWPAMTSDGDATTTNYGPMPEGALLMLPPTFDVTVFTGDMRKVATTLQRYGAYISDRNYGTPFALYVENGGPGLHFSNYYSDLDRLRRNLRRVIGAGSWVDGNDQPMPAPTIGRPNFVSARGNWYRQNGTATGVFDTWQQALVMTAAPGVSTFLDADGDLMFHPTWAPLVVGSSHIFTVRATGGARMKIQFFVGSTLQIESPLLSNGQTWQFTWTLASWTIKLWVASGADVASSCAPDIRPVNAFPYDMSLGKVVLPPQPSAAAAAPYPDPVNLPAITFGTYRTPFSVNSLWNSRPLNPVLEAPVIPMDFHQPMVSTGSGSATFYQVGPNDPSMTIYAPGGIGPGGVLDTESLLSRNITLVHFPTNVVNATHTDIFDNTTGLIHSFYLLQFTLGGVWTASSYSWSTIAGTGMPDPSKPIVGSKPTGVAASAGLIRQHEIEDGLAFYRHALALSLTWSGLSGGPDSILMNPGNPTGVVGFVYPATSSNSDLTRCYGKIPQGSLLMLPPSFNTSTITTLSIRKIAETLKRYGGYVVDRNDQYPFIVYVENGNVTLSTYSTSTNPAATVSIDLQRIRAQLSRVLSSSSWINGAGATISAPAPGLANVLSMRGTYTTLSGTATWQYDSTARAIVFGVSGSTRTQIRNTGGAGIKKISWSSPQVNSTQIFTAQTTGGAQVGIQIFVGGTSAVSSNMLNNTQTYSFKWPAGVTSIYIFASSGISVTTSTAAATLVPQVPYPFNSATGSYYVYP